MHTHRLGVDSLAKPDEELFNYIDGFLNPLPNPIFHGDNFSSIEPDQQLDTVWKFVNSPERSLVVALFLFGLAHQLVAGRVRDVVMEAGRQKLNAVFTRHEQVSYSKPPLVPDDDHTGYSSLA